VPKRQFKLTSKSVPYMNERVPQDARPYIPQHHDEWLDYARDRAFVEETKERPDVRLAVLSVLRVYSMNGAETPAAIFAILLAAITILASSVASQLLRGIVVWLIGIAAVAGCIWFTRAATSAHVRRLTCGVWLAAYEDALR
jgi:Flp pilus assembly protein TadB